MKKRSRPHSCNVLSLGAEARQLWHFNTRGSKVSLTREHSGPLNGLLPAGEVRKDWRDLLQPRLNIAWLPADQVFLRVAHLPAADAGELQSMLELQLEKLSPLPLAQVIWSFEPIPKAGEGLQSVIVVFVARSVIEQFLGRLESQGYQPDRLEVPAIRQLLATPVSEDGVWIHPRLGEGRVSCLIAWWTGGVLRDLGLVNLPADDTAAEALHSHISNTAWAGELEGWLTGPLRWHIVADQETAAATAKLWQTEEDLQLVEPPALKAVAELSAQKTAAGAAQANLLPPDFTARYRQRYVDRLWMRALGTVLALYVVGVVVYFAWMKVVDFKAGKVATEAREMGGSYTNALRLKALGEIMQDQLTLRFAALDSWRVVSEHIPDGLKLNSFSVSRGKTVFLTGEGPADGFDKLAEFNGALAKATLTNGGPLFFSKVTPPQSQTSGNNVIRWSFNCELGNAEIP